MKIKSKVFSSLDFFPQIPMGLPIKYMEIMPLVENSWDKKSRGYKSERNSVMHTHTYNSNFFSRDF